VLGDSDKQQCTTVIPLLEAKATGHFVACHFPEVRADIAAGEDQGVDAGPVDISKISAPPSSGGLDFGKHSG
jgi:hypothetical protein